MYRLLSIAGLVLVLSGCSTGILSLYEEGDLFTRQFLNFIPSQKTITGDYYEVRKNQKNQITSAIHYSRNKKPIEKSHYGYSRDGKLSSHHYVEYFGKGLPRIAKEWLYKNGKIIQREEQWFTRSRTLEKKLTIFYDNWQRPYLEQTWGLGDRFESSTEYYYDHKNRLDKSRRNFFDLEGQLRDYWLTIYNDENQIMTEEHYLPDNSLLTFYRYTYHPVKLYREQEEILDADRNVFILRTFDKYGLVLLEEEKTRELQLQKRKVFEYNKNHRPLFIHYFNDKGVFVKKVPYKKSVYLKPFRTPAM